MSTTIGIPRGRRCHREHPYERLYLDSRGRVICRECRRERSSRYYHNHKRQENRKRLVRWRNAQRRDLHPGKRRKGTIPNALLRDAVLRYLRLYPDDTYEDIAFRAGWLRKNHGIVHETGDASVVKRAIGVESRSEKGAPYCSLNCKEDTALRIAAAAHVDPWEIGL